MDLEEAEEMLQYVKHTAGLVHEKGTGYGLEFDCDCEDFIDAVYDAAVAVLRKHAKEIEVQDD